MSAEMINNHKKVVFLDVDGTMVNDRGEIPESAKEAAFTLTDFFHYCKCRLTLNAFLNKINHNIISCTDCR